MPGGVHWTARLVDVWIVRSQNVVFFGSGHLLEACVSLIWPLRSPSGHHRDQEQNDLNQAAGMVFLLGTTSVTSVLQFL